MTDILIVSAIQLTSAVLLAVTAIILLRHGQDLRAAISALRDMQFPSAVHVAVAGYELPPVEPDESGMRVN